MRRPLVHYSSHVPSPSRPTHPHSHPTASDGAWDAAERAAGASAAAAAAAGPVSAATVAGQHAPGSVGRHPHHLLPSALSAAAPPGGGHAGLHAHIATPSAALAPVGTDPHDAESDAAAAHAGFRAARRLHYGGEFAAVAAARARMACDDDTDEEDAGEDAEGGADGARMDEG